MRGDTRAPQRPMISGLPQLVAVQLIEALALQQPPLSVEAIRRAAADWARSAGERAPSRNTVRRTSGSSCVC
jgi:hypothetical protein